MWAAKCRRPKRYTCSKSVCRSKRTARGNARRFGEVDGFKPPLRATPLTGNVLNSVFGIPPIPPPGKIYSRKPGLTETRLRPLARRREITARPPLVFIRVRNPCVFDR